MPFAGENGSNYSSINLEYYLSYEGVKSYYFSNY
jgi:hypothetical protein